MAPRRPCQQLPHLGAYAGLLVGSRTGVELRAFRSSTCPRVLRPCFRSSAIGSVPAIQRSARQRAARWREIHTARAQRDGGGRPASIKTRAGHCFTMSVTALPTDKQTHRRGCRTIRAFGRLKGSHSKESAELCSACQPAQPLPPVTRPVWLPVSVPAARVGVSGRGRR